MRVAWFILLLALGTCSVPAQSGGNPPERIRVGGKDHVRLGDWARSEGFDVRWLKQDEKLQISKGSNSLVFIADSREAYLNGIQLWLLLPLESRDGRLLISLLDVKTTLEPLLSPRRTGTKVQTITIDPGHGGKDPGNRNGRLIEKDLALSLAKELATQLRNAGFKVSLTRNWDSYPELSERPNAAKRHKADLFISLHFNGTSFGRGNANGAETYALTPAGGSSTAGNGRTSNNSYAGNRFNDANLLLASYIQQSLVGKLKANDRGVRRARFEVLRNATMPAVLIEGGFLSHPAESKKIADAAYRREMAKAITEAIQRYKRTVE